MNDQEILKRKSAEKAVEFVKSGMILGFGTGSTFNHVLYVLAEKLKSCEISNIVGIPSSEKTQKLASELNIPTSTLDNFPILDLTIDGADEVDVKLNVIKGGGGAHFREKIIAQASKKYIIIVDESKISKSLGEKWAVPVEVIQMAYQVELQFLQSLGAEVKPRLDSEGNLFITDEGNNIIDANFGVIKNPKKLARKLEKRAGIVEHGIFVNMADFVIVAKESGIEVLKKGE
ncbi:MAG: ribose-5-phosphate isomerase RpiA [Bacteroidetes bacterium]|nr:ribose-5-phosphate isomerase RpiA [Bacteroidota bacterium]MBU1116020.1 ribose-5-phosphate isomerase RpiA [Bacteroidota bacterium]MBU1799212.1 ribose-5-phosphate isomerase RpiA [Bacteroidota bacterium]